MQGAQEDPETQAAEMVIPSALSELVEDTATVPTVLLPPTSPPVKVPEPVLDYQHVKRAFVQALFPTCEWTNDPKSAIDRFEHFARINHRRTSVKRPSDGSNDSKEKRRRHPSKATVSGTVRSQTPQLGSIGEQAGRQ